MKSEPPSSLRRIRHFQRKAKISIMVHARFRNDIARTKKPVILSTGMCEMEEIQAAMDALRSNGTPKITLLHCNTEYPTPYEDVNLRAMASMRERFGVDVGYSDHTPGIEVPIAAAALGAVVIEKHFTLDRTMEGL